MLNELPEDQKKDTPASAEMIAILKQLFEKTNIIQKELRPGGIPTPAERVRAIQLWCKDREEKKGLVPISPPVALPQSIIKYRYTRMPLIAMVAFAFLPMFPATGYHKRTRKRNCIKTHYQIRNERSEV